ncbi:phosphatidylinositol-4-phosphate 5-kinase [Plectosphaerella plurivora]|uniref:1-phosphatidylinositol-4-phosphate 5-kinase n=1 Tax=Plectosphaerella plurivora TaxID=936078 RepID=A0A9P8V3I6_9PEZI|nr:phosphatidylinositol-4-phosphate 5-kinase [Plectosphaerella plurivora]
MPTYLTHESSPVYTANTDYLDLDPNNTLAFRKQQHPTHAANGDTHHLVLDKHPSRNRNPHDSFDESSISSAQASDASDLAATQMNGTRPTSMSSLPNGKGINGGGPDDQDYNTTDTRRTREPPAQNGFVKPPERSAPPPPPPVREAPSPAMNGVSPRQTDAMQRNTSVVSGFALDSNHESPSDYTPSPRRHHDADHHVDGAAVSSEFNLPYRGGPGAGQPHNGAAAASSVSLSGPEHRARVAPHRLSSPPLYQTASASQAASSLQVPPNGGLKQRHTLEVPKPQPGRSSKDGADAAFTSGRFSPTAATPGTRRASLSLGRRNTRSIQSEGPRDEIIPDEDALRWAEALRQRRASKRKKREEEDDDRILVGTKVDEHHANWTTAYNMLTGIRVSVSRTNAKLERDLTDEDFQAKQKSTFDIAGNELVPSAKYDFKFKDYAPWVFRRLRTLFKLDPADYLMSLTGKYILSELGSPGKSGSFFYYSRDYKYIIKTIHHAEHKFLRKILKDYHRHVVDNPNTLLSQFYGLHRVKMPYGKKIHFVVMNNLFPPHRDIHTTFDLKGSTIGRDYKEEDLENNPRATLKDLNWLRRQRSLELGIQKKRLFLEQLNRDVVLLKKLQIMDYSLLVGIHDLRRGNEENLRGKTLQVFNPGGDGTHDDSEPQSVLLRTPSKLESARKAKELRQMIRSERPVPMGETTNMMPNELDEVQGRVGAIFNQDDGGLRATHEDNAPADEIYYLGVIDCLTHYGMIKKIEHFWKGLTKDRTQISALPPEQYGERFFHFVEGITMSAEEAARDKQAKEREAAEALAAEEAHERVPSWRTSSTRRRSTAASVAPPVPTHKPPPTPMASGQMSPEAHDTIERAEREAQRTKERGASEASVPDKVLTTIPSGDRRESGQNQPVLPVVEEAAEARSTSGHSRDGDDYRPMTPAKDDKFVAPRHFAPRSPPKHLKPESQDSGYETLAPGKGRNASAVHDDNGSIQPRLSKDSLNKDLPPLPNEMGYDGRARGYA